jgi:hypothetical protein
MYDMVNDMVEILEVIKKMELIFFGRRHNKHFRCGLHHTHNKGGPYSVEMLRLGILPKHIAQCKGHPKGGGVPLQLGIVQVQVQVHNHHEANLYYEYAFQIWIIHGRNKRRSSFVIRLHEGVYILLFVLFHWEGQEVGVG